MSPEEFRMLLGTALGAFAWAVSAHALGRLLGEGLTRLELLLLSFLTTAAFVSVIALLLAFAGHLSLPALAGVVAVTAITIDMAVIRKSGARREEKKKSNLKFPTPLETIPFLILIAGGIFLFFHPDENIAGNWDPGVYLSQGAALARGGSYRFDDTASPWLTALEKEEIYPLQRGHRVKYPGFFVSLSGEHSLDPQFYPIYPLWTAIIAILGDFGVSLYLGSLCSLFSLLLVMLIGHALAGRICAFASGVAFLLNPFQIWFSGFHTAELPMQLFFLAGLWSWLLYRRVKRSPLAFLAGLFFALTAFTSITGHLLAALAGLLHLLSTKRPRAIVAFFVPYLLLAPLAVWQSLSFSSQYISQVEVFLPAARRAVASPLLIGPTMLGLLLLLAVRLRRGQRTGRFARMAFGTSLILFTGVFIALVTDTLYSGGFEASRLTLAAAVTSKSNLLFALTGFCVLLWTRTGAGLVLVAFASAFTLLFSEHLMMVSLFPWAAKRFLVVTLPVLCLAVGIFWTRAIGLFRSRGMKVVLIALMTVFSLRPLYRGWDFAYHRDWRGLVPFTQRIADRLPDKSIVLAPRWIATPLDFIHGKTVIPLYLSGDGEALDRYSRLTRRLAEKGHRLYVVDEKRVVEELPFAGTAILEARLETSVLEQSRRPPAGNKIAREIDITVAEVR